MAGIGAVRAAGGKASAVFINPGDLTTVQLAALSGGYSISDPTQPGIERVGGVQLYPAPIVAGSALIADTRFLAVAVRRDAAVDFSEDAAFSRDAVAARVTMRVDYAPSDPAAFYLIT